MYKSKKYNIILVMMIFIISAVVGLSAGMAPSAGSSIDPGDTGAEVIIPPEEDEVPSGIKPPAANASPLRKIGFAIDMMNNGKGYHSTTTQTLEIHALNLKQYMRFSKHRGGGLDFTQEWFKFSGTGIIASQGKNEFRAVSTNGKTMHEKVIKDAGSYSFDAKTVNLSASGTQETFPYTDYTVKRNRMPVNDFFIEVKDEYISSIREDKRNDPNNYIITVIYNTSKIPEKYLSAFSENGGSGTKITSLQLTFYISKATGYLRKVVKNEDFVSASGPFKSDCTTTLEEVFVSMNRSYESDIKQMSSDAFGVSY